MELLGRKKGRLSRIPFSRIWWMFPGIFFTYTHTPTLEPNICPHKVDVEMTTVWYFSYYLLCTILCFLKVTPSRISFVSRDRRFMYFVRMYLYICIINYQKKTLILWNIAYLYVKFSETQNLIKYYLFNMNSWPWNALNLCAFCCVLMNLFKIIFFQFNIDNLTIL